MNLGFEPARAAERWIDLSVPLADGMVFWPGDPPVRIRRALDIERGDPASVTRLDMSAHTGTHVDAPAHFRAGGAGIDALPIEATIGEARLLEFPGLREIGRADLEPHAPRRGERLLLKTANSGRQWWSEPFTEEFVALTPDAAEFLGASRIACVGVDYLSVATPAVDGERVHRALLDAGVVIIEGLNLAPIASGRCELVCLPLRIAGADGAPARAIARPIERDTA